MTTLESARGTMTAYMETLIDRGPFAQFFAEDVSLYHGAICPRSALLLKSR